MTPAEYIVLLMSKKSAGCRYIPESTALRLLLSFSGALPFPPSCRVALLAVRGFLSVRPKPVTIIPRVALPLTPTSSDEVAHLIDEASTSWENLSLCNKQPWFGYGFQSVHEIKLLVDYHALNSWGGYSAALCGSLLNCRCYPQLGVFCH